VAESGSEARGSINNAKGIRNKSKVSSSEVKGIGSEAQVERTVHRVLQSRATRRELQHCSIELIIQGGRSEGCAS
jgi:hypothetical protein